MTSSLEKDYYSKIYSKSRDENKRLISSRKLAANILKRYSAERNDCSYVPKNHLNFHFFKTLDEEDSISSSLRKLGFESVSIESINNIRSNSYLKSIENECVESILVKMEPINEQNEEKNSHETDGTHNNVETCVENQIGIKKKNVLKNFVYKPFSVAKNFVKLLKPIDFQSGYYLTWLGIVFLAYIYNIISISIRYAFEYDKGYGPDFSNRSEITKQTNVTNRKMASLEKFFESDKKLLWLIADYICDLIYLIDIFLIQTRIKFIRDGMWVQDINSTSKKYFNSIKFIFDIASVIPFDVIQIIVGIFPLLRLNRCLKINSLWEFFDRWDRSVQSYAFLVRLIRLFVYLQIVVHFYACTYFKISLWETRNYQINNEWVYNFKDSHINNYVYSYLFGLKTASTIGNNPQPVTKLEYLFTAIAYVVALFLFALIVGQIRNIIGSLSNKQDSFLIVLDSTFRYINRLNLPDHLVKKVVLWFDYWSQEQKQVPFEAINFLPINVQTDLAIEVYFDLISKVKLFQECEKNLLYALVLKLKPITFMPGDFICKKGDVGREMFIVDKGIIEVVVDGKAVAQMKKGSYFGEISLLSMGDGGNRRTANVVSKGFSKLLLLKKNDLDQVVKSYPDMQQMLKKAAE